MNPTSTTPPKNPVHPAPPPNPVLTKGYKQTEIGVIPEDWEVSQLGNTVEFLDGKRQPIKSGDREKMKGVYPYYGASGIIDYVNDYLFDDDLILLGEDGENILSRSLPLAFDVSGKIWVNNHAHVLKPKDGFHIKYLTNLLESYDYELYNSGTAQPKLNKQTCYKIPICYPKYEEQRAIAQALSDTDALIASLDQLIAKKRLIKQGAMQQLLKSPAEGGRRLPGFNGEWENIQIGKYFDFKNGLNKEKKYFGDGIPIVNYMDVYKNSGLVKENIEGKVEVSGDELRNCYEIT